MAFDKYKRVLRTGQSASGVNRGFRAIDGNALAYEQVRTGLITFIQNEDGVSTLPLAI